MVGLNHEFARELLWRELPDRPARQLLPPVLGHPRRHPGRQHPRHAGPSTPGRSAHALGDNLDAGSTGQLVLLIRGELLRRYPNAIVYAVGHGQSRDPPARHRRALSALQRPFEPDVTFFGFNLPSRRSRGGGRRRSGWFFVIQQHPTEPRFGLDVRPPEPYLHPQGNAATTALALTQRPVRVAIHATVLLP